MNRSPSSKTHFILVRIHGFCVQPFISLLLGLVDVFADPDVSVQPQDEVYVAGQ